MKFILRQYWAGIKTRKSFLALIVIPPVLYLLIAAYLPSSYLITQDVEIDPEAPIAVAASPVDVKSVKETARQYEGFFRNVFAALELDELIASSEPNENLRVRSLLALVGHHMSMEIPETGRVRIRYLGKDKETGQLLVTYYTERLVQKASEGQARVLRQTTQTPQPGVDVTAEPVIHEVQITPQKEIWNDSRLSPLISVGILSLMAILCLIGILEMSDPSFKSERQLAQYLNCPFLGSLPDLSNLAAALDRRRD